MHRTLFVLLATLVTLFSSTARADVGPPPSCPSGTHREYLYGHKCVPDGSHLERDPEGGVRIVKDGLPKPAPKPTENPVVEPPPPAPSEAPPAPTEFASPPPTAAPNATTEPVAPTAETSTNPAPAAPPQRGCACGVPAAPEERIGFGVVIAAMIFAASRRMRKDRRAR